MKNVVINDRSARVMDEGSGPPVVVLHGWGGRIESMTPVLRCLTVSHRVVAIDLPGFGESPVPDGAWGTPDYSAFVRDLVTELGIERAHFVGHSFGAKVSFHTAAVYPDLVDKLVLVGSPGLRTPPSVAARAKRFASRTGRTVGKLGPPGRAVRQAIYKGVASSDYQSAGALRPILVKVVNEDYRDLLPRVRSSTLLVWGSEDDAAPLVHGQEMEKLIPDSGLVVFEGAGHFAYLDESERFCRIVRHFFGSPGG
jgi:pimeloyl-ACP methyl ester carboxylesterase